MARFIRDYRHDHADLYPELKVVFVSGAIPELYIRDDDGTLLDQFRIDHLSTQEIHNLLQEKGLRKLESVADVSDLGEEADFGGYYGIPDYPEGYYDEFNAAAGDIDNDLAAMDAVGDEF